MKFTIERNTVEVDYKSKDFWQQFDEVEVENPVGWYLEYVSGGIVRVFDYCQSTGRGDYCDEYCEETYAIPLHFTNDATANADIMRSINYDDKRAKLIRKL